MRYANAIGSTVTAMQCSFSNKGLCWKFQESRWAFSLGGHPSHRKESGLLAAEKDEIFACGQNGKTGTQERVKNG
jgi:hypothetical protein